MQRLTLLSLAALMLACTGPAPDETPTAASGETSGEENAEPSAGSAHSVCVSAMTRERECQEAFVPALVALRVRLDVPAGIAERAESEGQDALITEASEEYASDASDDAIEASCSELDALPEDEAAAIADAQSACLEAADCAAFVECQMAFHEARLSSGG